MYLRPHSGLLQSPMDLLSQRHTCSVEVNEAPPDCKAIEEAVKTLKNGKLGTDKIHPEGLKYQSSKNIFVYLTMLLFLIWLRLLIPMAWLELTIICLYKKGLKSLAANYRALSIVTVGQAPYQVHIPNLEYAHNASLIDTDVPEAS